MNIKSKIPKSPIIPLGYALEVSAFLIETGKFKRFYKEMQIADLQKEPNQMDKEE